MIIGIRKPVILLGVCLLIALLGCARAEEGEVLQPVPVLPEMEPVLVESEEVLPVEDEPESWPDEYTNYLEAYFYTLKENKASLIAQGNIGDGKIAIMDVLGDETPELLYIYSDGDIREYLKIFTYSEAEGVESIFDSRVFIAAGGGGNYCLYLTYDEELMAYSSMHGAGHCYGFWSIVALSLQEQEEMHDVYFYNYDAARLLYVIDQPSGDITYQQYGQEISKEQFDELIEASMGDIDRVIFQSTGISPYGLYEREELWKDLTPFVSECMTYDEAIEWLGVQYENQYKM